jgi:DNA-binding MarR family transcriptional regulator
VEATSKADKLYGVIRQIRLGFNQLRALGDALHQDLGITASMRAVMESLAEDGEQTVPQIARRKSVSRQHIQVNVDALLKVSIVVLRHNPAHRRSPVIAMTKRGQSAFKEMRRREKGILNCLAKEFAVNELEQALKVLARLNDTLMRTREKGDPHD